MDSEDLAVMDEYVLALRIALQKQKFHAAQILAATILKFCEMKIYGTSNDSGPPN